MTAHRWRKEHFLIGPQQVKNEFINQIRLVMQNRRGRGGDKHCFLHSILAEDFAMLRVSANFVPKLLTMELKQHDVGVFAQRDGLFKWQL